MKKTFPQKTVYLLLLLFVISSAVFLYFFSLKVDKKYSDLILTETVVSHNIYKLANNHSRNINLLFNASHIYSSDSIKKIQNEWEKNNAKDSVYFNILSNSVFLTPHNREPLLKLMALQKDNTDLCRAFFEIKTNNYNDSAFTLLRNKIAPAYYAFRDKLESLLDTNNQKLLEISDRMTAEHEKTGLLYLTMGATPFLFLVGYVIFGLVLLIYLAFQIFKTDRS